MTASGNSSEHIGCIDGSVLTVTRQGAQIHLHLGGSVAPLSRIAAERLAELLSPTSSQSPSVPLAPTQGGSRRVGVAANPGVADLLAAGLVEDGTILTLRHHGVEHTATVCPDGDIEFDGRRYSTLSAAARAACAGASMNGWTAWKLFDGPHINDLRWLFRANEFPGEGHRYSPSSAGEMRQIARWWVQHALEQGLDPADPSDEEIEALLGGNGYADSTLGSYRRHLRNWRLLYGKEAPDDGPRASGDDNVDPA